MPRPGHFPTPHPNTCRGGAGSICSKSSWSTSKGRFQERDFADIAELGFNFVRLPLDYRCWTATGNLKKLKEPVLKEIDQAVELGRKHSVHVQINFHRAPGFTVASPPEAKSLWTDAEIQEVCCAPLGKFRGEVSRYSQQPYQLQPA